jgi:hypothetical protein
MTKIVRRFITLGVVIPWPPTWPLAWFWRAPGNVPAELAENERALEAAAAKLSRKATVP